MTIHTLGELLVLQLQDLYSAEKQLVKALPKMEEAASSKQLKEAFRNHLKETQGQVERLEEVFSKLDHAPKEERCDAMLGLIKEAQNWMEMDMTPEVRDAALIASAQRIEHYEIAGYGTARAFAQNRGHFAVAELLQTTLDEEGNANKALNQLAETWVNFAAAGEPVLTDAKR